MIINEKIERLQKEIDNERLRMSSCNHSFEKPYFNPETKIVSVEYFDGYETHGVHMWPRTVSGNETKTIDRWTRKCRLCGIEEHTNKIEPVIKEYKPVFK